MRSLTLNGKATTVDADPSTPILWAVRDNLGLTGTKSALISKMPQPRGPS